VGWKPGAIGSTRRGWNSGASSAWLGSGGVRGSALPMIWRGVRSCSKVSCACTSAALPNQRRGASAHSRLHSATSDMPWWCAMKLRTTVKSCPSLWREAVKSTAS
jgi:hypothetical protein